MTRTDESKQANTLRVSTQPIAAKLDALAEAVNSQWTHFEDWLENQPSAMDTTYTYTDETYEGATWAFLAVRSAKSWTVEIGYLDENGRVTGKKNWRQVSLELRTWSLRALPRLAASIVQRLEARHNHLDEMLRESLAQAEATLPKRKKVVVVLDPEGE